MEDMGSRPPEKSRVAIGFLRNSGTDNPSRSIGCPSASRGRSVLPSVNYFAENIKKKTLSGPPDGIFSISACILAHGRIQRGAGGPDPPEKSQNYKVSLLYWSGFPEKSQCYQASIQCWAII